MLVTVCSQFVSYSVFLLLCRFVSYCESENESENEKKRGE